MTSSLPSHHDRRRNKYCIDMLHIDYYATLSTSSLVFISFTYFQSCSNYAAYTSSNIAMAFFNAGIDTGHVHVKYGQWWWIVLYIYPSTKFLRSGRRLRRPWMCKGRQMESKICAGWLCLTIAMSNQPLFSCLFRELLFSFCSGFLRGMI